MEVECRHLSTHLSLGEALLPINKNSITNTTIANIDYSMQEHDMYSAVKKCTDGTQSPRSASFGVLSHRISKLIHWCSTVCSN